MTCVNDQEVMNLYGSVVRISYSTSISVVFRSLKTTGA